MHGAEAVEPSESTAEVSLDQLHESTHNEMRSIIDVHSSPLGGVPTRRERVQTPSVDGVCEAEAPSHGGGGGAGTPPHPRTLGDSGAEDQPFSFWLTPFEGQLESRFQDSQQNTRRWIVIVATLALGTTDLAAGIAGLRT